MPSVKWQRDLVGYSNTYGCEVRAGEVASLDNERAKRAVSSGLAVLIDSEGEAYDTVSTSDSAETKKARRRKASPAAGETD